MSFDILNPNATVSIAFEGLAICCYNQSHNNNRGRWEVAIPRFRDHLLTIEMPNLGTITVEETVRTIEIKDRIGVAVTPKHEVGATFDRKDKDKMDKHDFRWIVDFTNSGELPHGNVSVITKAENPDRVDVTMLYVYDATFYTKDLERDSLIRSDLEKTAPVVDGVAGILPTNVVSLVLDAAQDYGFETKTLGIDIQSSRGGSVDIIFDGVITTTIPQGTKPQEILIVNLELPTTTSTNRFVLTTETEYALADFYRYYELFRIDGTKSHLWGKRSNETGVSSNRTTDCGKILVNLPNLDALL